MKEKNICETIEPLIYLWVGGELTEEERQRVRAHVAECEHCRRLYEEARESRERVRKAGESPPPATDKTKVIEGVMNIVEAEKESRSPAGNLLRVIRGLASAAAVALLALFLYQTLWTGRGRLPRNIVRQEKTPSTEWEQLKKYRTLFGDNETAAGIVPFEKILAKGSKTPTSSNENE